MPQRIISDISIVNRIKSLLILSELSTKGFHLK